MFVNPTTFQWYLWGLIDMQVRLGTVDIFQGQEAKIVIVSLVRNSGTFETGSASIGFLKVLSHTTIREYKLTSFSLNPLPE